MATLKDSELKSILAEVEAEISSLLKSEGAALKKAKEDEEGGGGDSAAPTADAGSAPAPAEGSAPAGGSPTPAPAEASAPAPAGPEAGAGAAPPVAPAEGSAPGGDPAAEAGPVDPQALEAEYAQLDPESLKMHYMAAKSALFKVMGAASAEGSPAPAGPEAGAGAAPPPAAAPAGPAAGAPPAMKSEVPASIKDAPATSNVTNESRAAVPDAVKPLGKTEQDLNKAEIEDLKTQVGLLTKALEMTINRPERKAVTSVAHVPRTEEAPVDKPLTKSEIDGKIKNVLKSGKLNKSEKDMLFSFTLGNTSFDKIKGLLDRK